LRTTSFKNKNILLPGGKTKIKRARAIWTPTPQIISLQFILRLSWEKSQATPIKKKIPAKLIRLYWSMILIF
jgi:hypothetical protein